MHRILLAFCGSVVLGSLAQVAISAGIRPLVMALGLAAYLLPFLPAILWREAKAPGDLLLLVPFLFGFLGPLAAGSLREIATTLGYPDALWDTTLAPPVEEALKLAGVLVAARAWLRVSRGSPESELLLGGALAGIGFGLSETVSSYLGSLGVRLLTSVPAHGAWTFLATCGLVLALRRPRGSVLRLLLPVALYGVATALHAGWNIAIAANLKALAFLGMLGWLITALLAWRIRTG